jgi:serine/threonine protein kinase
MELCSSFTLKDHIQNYNYIFQVLKEKNKIWGKLGEFSSYFPHLLNSHKNSDIIFSSDFFDIISQFHFLSRVFFIQLLLSLYYLQSKNIIHNDLNPSNVFICEKQKNSGMMVISDNCGFDLTTNSNDNFNFEKLLNNPELIFGDTLKEENLIFSGGNLCLFFLIIINTNIFH